MKQSESVAIPVSRSMAAVMRPVRPLHDSAAVGRVIVNSQRIRGLRADMDSSSRRNSSSDGAEAL